MKIIKFSTVFFLLICFSLFRLNSLNQRPSEPEEFSWINKVEIYVLGLAMVGVAYPIYPEIAYEHLTLYWPDDGDTEVIHDDFFMESKVIKNAIQKAKQTESEIKLEWPVSAYVMSFDYDTYMETRVALAFNGGSLKLEGDEVIVSVPIEYPKRAFAPLIRIPKIGTIGVQEGLFWVLQESGWYHTKELIWIASLHKPPNK